MRFLLDENADYTLVAFLQELGHDVTSIAHDYPAALKDTQLLSIAASEQRILITNDKDFGELIVRRQLPHAGVLLFRLADEEVVTKQNWLVHMLTHYADQLDRFIVISDAGIRIRRIADV